MKDQCEAPCPAQRATWLTLGLAAAGLTLLSGCANGAVRSLAKAQVMKEQVMQTDRDFAALAQRQGVAEAFRAYAADDATLLPMGESPVTGREAIFTVMSGGPAGTLTWTPVAADVARRGDLGYTWGRYEFRGTDQDGQPAVRHGKYVTIWKRQPDGSWKYVVDIGNPSPPPP